MTARRAGWLLVTSASLVLAACSSGASGTSTGVDPAVRLQLRRDLTGLVSAASAHRRGAAESALAALDQDAAAAHVAGKLDDAHLAAIRAAAARVQADLAPATPTATPTVTVSAPAPAPKPAGPPKPDKGHGKHGKGHGGD